MATLHEGWITAIVLGSILFLLTTAFMVWFFKFRRFQTFKNPRGTRFDIDEEELTRLSILRND
jgi:hypothetical protein